MSGTERKLGVLPLAALVVGAMIGGGIFSLPQNMAQDASAGAVCIAWVITGLGIFFLASTFRILSAARPDATTGIYSYSRLGFGRFAGFEMAWAYWLCNIFGNVGYAVLLMDAFNYFFPGRFTGGNNLASIIGGSIVIWLMNYAVWRGVRQAAFINVAGTVAKLLPLAIFIVVMLIFFKWQSFDTDFTGHRHFEHLAPLPGMQEQVKSTMLVTLWAFIGIEGAVVISDRAKNPRSVGLATVIGFLICLVIYALISLLPFGVMSQHELSTLDNPSTALILQMAVHGKWGGVLMNLGVIIALLSSWLAFTIMVSQIPYAAGNDGTFPEIFKKSNRFGSPAVSLIVTSSIMQLSMLLVYFASNAWNTKLSITGVMILPPYLGCTLYLWKFSEQPDFPENSGISRTFARFCGIAGSAYALWMIYAAGLNYLVMALVFGAIGIPVFWWTRSKIDGTRDFKKLFTPAEQLAVLIIVLVSAAGVIAWATGKIKL